MKKVNVDIFDTTMRDGAQALPKDKQFKPGDKVEIANSLASLGITVIEAGFPSTPNDFDEVSEVSKIVGQTEYKAKSSVDGKYMCISPVIAGLSPAIPQNLEVTWQAVSHALRPRIHTFIPTDPEHIRAKFAGKRPEEVLGMGIDAIKYARRISGDHPGASVEFSAEAASTSDFDFLERVVKSAVSVGVDVINVPDTVGQRDPFWMREFYGRVIGWAMSENCEVIISAHNHNDIDQATANTLALVYAASDYSFANNKDVNIQLETAICGLGERAGNADVFPVIASLEKFTPNMPTDVRWVFNNELSVKTAERVMKFAGLKVDRQSPVVGRDTNVHRSGIHSDGITKGGHRMYTPHDPTYWGHNKDAVHEDGKYQGKKGRSAIAENV